MSDDEGLTEVRVRDVDRELVFTGVLLSSGSSARPGKDRWAEVAIHRTAAGNYVVSGCGRSTRQGEVNKHWAQECEAPEAVVDRMHLSDGLGGKYLPYVNRLVLTEAAERDPALREAFLVTRVD